MSANTRKYSITDSSDSSPIILRTDSREIILRNAGGYRAYFGFNGSVSTDADGCFGLYVNPNEVIVFTGLKADADIYARCNAGEYTTLMGEIR